jgi:hypothetical protein
MQDSLPSYKPQAHGCDNFYRINYHDERSVVKGYFMQFNFFPWDQDFIDLYNNFGKSFELRNNINELITSVKKIIRLTLIIT